MKKTKKTGTASNTYADTIEELSEKMQRSDNFKILDRVERFENKDGFLPPFPYGDNSKREYNYNK